MRRGDLERWARVVCHKNFGMSKSFSQAHLYARKGNLKSRLGVCPDIYCWVWRKNIWVCREEATRQMRKGEWWEEPSRITLLKAVWRKRGLWKLYKDPNKIFTSRGPGFGDHWYYLGLVCRYMRRPTARSIFASISIPSHWSGMEVKEKTYKLPVASRPKPQTTPTCALTRKILIACCSFSLRISWRPQWRREKCVTYKKWHFGSIRHPLGFPCQGPHGKSGIE